MGVVSFWKLLFSFMGICVRISKTKRPETSRSILWEVTYESGEREFYYEI